MDSRDATKMICPFTFGVPANVATEREYFCMGRKCMAWEDEGKLSFIDNDGTEVWFGHCELIFRKGD